MSLVSHAQLAALVAASYSQTPTVRVNSDVMAVVSDVGSETVVAIPGTRDIPGWLLDLSAWPRWFRTIGPCHAGFGAAGQELWDKVGPVLSPGRRVVYAAHSLGGALAQVLAAMHAAERRPPCRCVTFGSPRVGTCFSPDFRSLVRSACDLALYRRVGDPVYKVPFRPLYLHVKTNVILGALVAPVDNMKNHSIAQYAADLAELNL